MGSKMPHSLFTVYDVEVPVDNLLYCKHCHDVLAYIWFCWFCVVGRVVCQVEREGGERVTVCYFSSLLLSSIQYISYSIAAVCRTVVKFHRNGCILVHSGRSWWWIPVPFIHQTEPLWVIETPTLIINYFFFSLALKKLNFTASYLFMAHTTFVVYKKHVYHICLCFLLPWVALFMVF